MINLYSFKTIKQRNTYYLLMSLFFILGVIFTLGLLLYNNPIPIDSPSFIPSITRRINSIIAMGIASICHSAATVSFQTVAQNKIITPSILGFEALYSTIQTSLVYFFGLTTLINFSGNTAFIIQLLIMMIFSILLYSWFLFGKQKNLQLLILIGIVFGTGLKSFAAFMRRLLNPNEFDVLQAKLFASVNNSNSDSFPIAIALVILSVTIIFINSRKLNVLALGKDVAINLGVNHKKITTIFLIFISILISVSTSLIGPITFLGFLVSMLTYQIAKTYDHKYLLPMSILVAYLIMTAAYFIMNHIFYAQGVVSILIEFVGGITFLVIILRRGSL
ncbi:iron chelate uptake ABC transporter family permease subunit [Helcococcus bovis]|uniref:iron chelate uptake ABC transporter family permease subunit n=1 Tax=Helcococcus bovis TaxID=3153252 RepID=UPI0038B72994